MSNETPSEFQITQSGFVWGYSLDGEGHSQVVNPGDVIVADADGVVVVPRERAEAVLKAGRDRLTKEEKTRERLRNRELGFVFQQFHLLPELTALENVMLPMVYAGVPADQRRERALAALERVGLASRVNNRPNQLSGGQQQRVAVARAIINQPKLLLADEPTGALDSRTTGEVLDLFDELHREQGMTILLVTHEHDVAERAERVVHFHDGRLVESGAGSQL